MRIGEFEKASGLNRTTVRYYERRGLLKPYPAADGKGYRRYGPEHVERARMIRMGQSLGFSIAELLRLLKAWDGKALSAEQKSRILKQKRSEIEAKQAALVLMTQYIDAKLAWIAAGEIGTGPAISAYMNSSA